MKRAGRISLVGAGPGDPGLLTLKARKRLREADLIVYDTLANPRHLVHAKRSAKTLCVGEGFRHKKNPQDRVNRLIVSSARRGLNVVRLKGGDPCLFGRGGEEALFFAQRGLPFEFVPGVTTATAAAAYAGVPLTHRDHNAAVTFVTGHRAHDETLDSIDWKKIAGLDGTIVVYMGFYNLGIIAEKLQQAGLAPNTPVLVVEWGTLGRQRSVDGTLATIERLVAERKFGPPCLLVIGGVVSLRRELGWFEKLPLFGKKIVITRPGGRCDRLHAKLTELGAEALPFPVIAVEPPKSWKAVDAAIRELHRHDWVVFTSVSGVKMFLNRLFARGRDARAFGAAKIAAIGPETARMLEAYGLKADRIPERFETRSLARAFSARKKLSSTLLVRTGLADKALDRSMEKAFERVARVDAYRTVLPKTFPADIRKTIAAGSADIVTFTSASTVDHFVRALGKAAVRKISRKTRFASIGPATSAALKRHGFRPWVEARVHTFDGLVDAMTGPLGKLGISKS